jgi:hypothetical protein
MSPEDAPPKDDELVAPDTYEGDASWLKKNFAGKTRAEAIRMFEQRAAANLAGDFLFMSHKGLAYYLPAALFYIQSPASKGDGDFEDWITTALSIRREHDEHIPMETRQLIRDIAYSLTGLPHKFCPCENPEDPLHIPNEYADRLEAMAKPD